MRILFAGSPAPARKTLELLFEKQADCGFEIAGVLSNPPSAKGRHKELTPTPVAEFALEKHLALFTPGHLDAAAREKLGPLGSDMLVSFAYGHIFGPKFLAMFPLGGINLHPSLLPKYRGCSPVTAAILNRDAKTAVTVQTLALKMDEGDILAQKIITLDGTETAQSLLDYSAEKGAELIAGILEQAAKTGRIPDGIPQQGEPSYTGTITKEDGRIDWTDGAAELDAKIRAYFPEPGAWCTENGQPLRILAATVIPPDDARAVPFAESKPGTVLQFSKQDGIYIKTGRGILCATQLQRQGKKAMGHKDFMNGARDFVGSVLH